jgi:hypothetical protein
MPVAFHHHVSSPSLPKWWCWGSVCCTFKVQCTRCPLTWRSFVEAPSSECNDGQLIFFSIKLQTTDRLYHDSINVGHSSLFFCPSLSVDESWVHFSKKGKSRDQYSSWLAHWHALYIVQRKRRKSTTIKRNFRNFPRKPMQMRLNKILIGVQSCSFQDFFLQQDKVYCIGYIYICGHVTVIGYCGKCCQ